MRFPTGLLLFRIIDKERNRMRIIQKMLSLIMAVCLIASMGLPCFADEYNLDDGDILIDFREDENQQIVQHVTQNEVSAPDTAPLIYSSSETTSNTITVDTDSGQTAQFTIQDVNIQTVPQESGIDFTAGTTAEMTVIGTNTVNNVPADATSGTAAGIHIGDQADVTIQGAEGGTNSLTVNAADSEKTSGAGIGTNQYEDFTGSLTITGNVTVEGNGVKYGAGVGSGQGGDFSGTLNVQDGAALIGDSGLNSAGVGGGSGGDFTGDLHVSDAAIVGTSYNNGAGIGAGSTGDFTGTMEFTNADVTGRAGYTGTSGNNWGFGGNGAGIGAGYNGDYSGSITIQDSSVEAAALNDGAAIGAGGIDSAGQTAVFSGSLTIDNSTVNASAPNQGIPIGAPGVTWKTGELGEFAGTVKITGDSEVNLMYGKEAELGDSALIGGNSDNNTGKVTVEDTAQINVWTGTLDTDTGSSAISYDRDSYKKAFQKDGTMQQLQLNQLPLITNGAEVEIVLVPKTQAESKAVHANKEAVAADFFWADLESRILSAEKGETITADAGSRTTMPTRILTLLSQQEVNLNLQWNGGEDIQIPWNHNVEFRHTTITLQAIIEQLAA